MKKKHSIEKVSAVMLALAVLAGVTACGNSSDQTDSGQSATGQMEEELSVEDDAIDSSGRGV